MEELARPEDSAIHQGHEADHVAQLYDDHMRRMRFKAAVAGGAELTKWANAPKLEAWELIKARFDDPGQARYVFMLVAASNEAGGR